MTARIEPWGQIDGMAVERAVLRNAGGLEASIISLGAALQRLTTPAVDGTALDLMLGYDTAQDYQAKGGHMGATAGRFANRIAHGRFTLDGKGYQLPLSENGRHHLHGGPVGFGRRLWQLQVDGARPTARLTLVSPAGDQGYPGTLRATCTYALRDDDVLAIEMTATTDAPTPINLVHHSYWNLAGSGGIEGHRLEVEADAVLDCDADNIPTGAIVPVAGGELDFRTPKLLGAARVDHCFVLRDAPGLRRVARLEGPAGRRAMEVWADRPGVQVYTAFKLDTTGYGGRHFGSGAGVCLETEAFPDAPNHPHFPSAILRPGEAYLHRMEHRFELG